MLIFIFCFCTCYPQLFLKSNLFNYKNVPSAHQLPYPSILRGKGFLFFLLLYHNKFMNKHMTIIQEIFADHYEEILYTLHPRATEIENIEKMVNRGNLYSQKRTEAMANQLVAVRHRHCVFTIPEELRHFFKEKHTLLDCLVNAVHSIVSRMFYSVNNSKNFTPGFICVLHTFEHPLEWNPHINCLISESGHSDDGEWRNIRHFNYNLLRESFRTILLNELEAHLGPSFKCIKAQMYKLHDKGFYVYAKPSLADPKAVTKYVGRYLGRPVIASKRIDHYNKEDDTVMFHYNRHEDNKYVERTLPAIEFIKLLMQHIPEKHFKMIRYYGIYARHRKIDENLHRQRTPKQRRLFASFTRWREAILLAFGYDPIQCPNCKETMEILEIYKNHHRVSLQELYERAHIRYMANHWRSSA